MKINFLLIIILLSSSNSFGQWYNKIYGNKELYDLKPEELSLLFDKSNNTKKTGIILTISGTTSAFLGSALIIVLAIDDIFSAMETGETKHPKYLYRLTRTMVVTGPFITAGGITCWIIGARRNREIKKAMNVSGSETSLHITPVLQLSANQNQSSVGLSVSLRF
jgi:hypothetical protein